MIKGFQERGISSPPYPGLRSFQSDEADFFFGREELVEKLSKKLLQKHFLTLVGPSGIGKTSFTRAGIIPYLQNNRDGTNRGSWCFVVTRPGLEPIHNLVAALQNEPTLKQVFLREGITADFLCATLKKDPLQFIKVLQRLLSSEQANLLLLVDRFEGLFRFSVDGANEYAEFLETLFTSVDETKHPLYIVTTLRSDFMGDFVRFPGLTELMNECSYLIPRLSLQNLRDAISNPAVSYGGTVDTDLVSLLLQDMTAGDHDQLPLMQFALRQMWLRKAQSVSANSEIRLTVNDYQAIGGLANPISLQAEETFSALTDKQRNVAELMFKRLTERNSQGFTIRRPESLSSLVSVVEVSRAELLEVIALFQSHGFVTENPGDGRDPQTIVNVSHEIVLRHWKRLASWIDEEASTARVYLRLEDTARRNEKGEAGLLRSPELDFALEWREQTKPTIAWANRYGTDFELVMNFLDMSFASRRADDSDTGKLGKVFISYRRRDSGIYAKLISEKLIEQYGKDQVFMDLATIRPGSDFIEEIDRALESCSVLLALIGHQWLVMADAEGRRRLDIREDLVRREIANALKREIQVIPVLLDGVQMPRVEELADELSEFPSRQYLKISYESLTDDLDRLADSLGAYVQKEP